MRGQQHPGPRRLISLQVREGPLGRLGRGDDALPQDIKAAIQYDVEDRCSPVFEPVQDLAHVALVEQRLRRDEVLPGLGDQGVSSGDDEWSPRGPVLEVRDGEINEIQLEHVADRLGIEDAEAVKQTEQRGRGRRLASTERAVEPDDHGSNLDAPRGRRIRLDLRPRWGV